MSGNNSIKTWHLLFRGFRQQEGDLSGMQHLWRKLLGQHGGPNTVVDCRAWWEDVDEIASNIFAHANSEPPTICLYGYSWGGFTAVKLARELLRRGLPVRYMVLSDAVYRHWYKLGQWRAFAPWSEIAVSDNVVEVYQFRQTCNRPRGHRLVADNPKATLIHAPVTIVHIPHENMDDLSMFHNLAEDVASGVLTCRDPMSDLL